MEAIRALRMDTSLQQVQCTGLVIPDFICPHQT